MQIEAGARVLTPLRRPAIVKAIDGDGRLQLKYVEADEVVLRPELVRLQAAPQSERAAGAEG